MNLQLAGKTIVVTAASQGLGKAIALELARAGAKLAICSRNHQRLHHTAEEIRQSTGSEVLAVTADVSNAEQISDFFRQVKAQYGNIYGLVCNAGGPPAGTFRTLTDQDWDTAIQLNLMSVVRLIREAIPLMSHHGLEGGRIVNLASSSVKQPIAGLVLSNTIRLGVQGLIKSLADELAPHILLNTVSPGRFDTERLKQLDEAKAARLQQSYQEIRQQAEQEVPVGRYGTPEEFAAYVSFLVSPANTYMTGQHVLVDGGLTRGVM